MPTTITYRKPSLVILLFVALLWCIKSAEVLFEFSLIDLGVQPLALPGLIGIVFAPLIHGSFEHLTHNTLAVVILSYFLFTSYPITKTRVLFCVWIGSGLGVWLFARDASHIGASGLTHGLFFYIFVMSILRRDKRSVGIMLASFLLYGGMTMSIFPREPGISFEYHFFGAVCGTLCALYWRKAEPIPLEKKYDWEESDEDDPVIGDLWKEDLEEDKSN